MVDFIYYMLIIEFLILSLTNMRIENIMGITLDEKKNRKSHNLHIWKFKYVDITH